MLARCRRHVVKLHHVHSNSIGRAANAWECLRMPECISVSVARSSLSVCVHPHAFDVHGPQRATILLQIVKGNIYGKL